MWTWIAIPVVLALAIIAITFLLVGPMLTLWLKLLWVQLVDAVEEIKSSWKGSDE